MSKISVYSTAWNINKHHFDYRGALDNWSTFSDQISIAVGTSEDDTYEALESYAHEKGYHVSLIKTDFDFENDPFAYGKTENAALQNCDGELRVQQNLDERMRVSKDMLHNLNEVFLYNPTIGAFFVPVINLYGGYDRYLDISRKWYIHRSGYSRGPVNFGLKPDGKPDYNKTSTDELIDRHGNLAPTVPLLNDLSIESVRSYVAKGMPITYHLGYVDFKERLDRSIWWKKYWETVTGDPNQHPTSIEEIAARETKVHNLPLWESKK